MASFELLPVQGVHPRGCAARVVPRAWRQGGTMGASGQRVHAPVRGHGRGTGEMPAGRGRGRVGRRA